MYRKYLNARSPLRLLEKGLHGGLGTGNVGAVVAGPGIGKSSFVVGVATDALLRDRSVLHITLDHSVGHVRDYYDSVFGSLSKAAKLDDPILTHAEIDSRRRIRAYAPGDFSPARLSEAIKIESEAGASPTLVLIEGLATTDLIPSGLRDLCALAEEKGVEIWVTLDSDDDETCRLPAAISDQTDALSVILTLEPEGAEVRLRAIKDHENQELQNLHVALDPTTMLLVRH